MEEKNKELIEKLIKQFESGELSHELKTWANFEEKEKKLLEKIADINKKQRQRNRRYLLVASFILLLISLGSLYIYTTYKSANDSYAILPGNVREINIRAGKAWISGKSNVDVKADSIITLHDGEIYLKKENNKESIIINTPVNKVEVISGEANIVSRNYFERITALGNAMVSNSKDTVLLHYGQEMRVDSVFINVHTIQSTEYVGAFRFGKIGFENESLAFVLAQLEAFYNIKIDYVIIPNVLVSIIVNKTDNPLTLIRQILPPGWICTVDTSGHYIIKANVIDGK